MTFWTHYSLGCQFGLFDLSAMMMGQWFMCHGTCTHINTTESILLEICFRKSASVGCIRKVLLSSSLFFWYSYIYNIWASVWSHFHYSNINIQNRIYSKLKCERKNRRRKSPSQIEWRMNQSSCIWDQHSSFRTKIENT